MASRRIVYLASLVGCLVFYYFYREWLSWLLLMCILFLPVLSLVLSLPAILTARGILKVPDTIPLGQPCHAPMLLTCSMPVPPFRGRLRVTHAVTGRTWTFKSNQALPADVCGRLKIELVRARVYDYLGLFRLPVKKEPQAIVYIWPDSTPIARVPDFAVQPPQQWKPKHGGGFAENHDLRLYRPGDNLQQIHWKLSAKTGKLILREAMDPIHRPIRLTLDLCGAPEELNRKLGRLLWLGRLLAGKGIPFDISALTGRGALSWRVESEDGLNTAMAELLSAPASEAGSLEDTPAFACRTYHIGGAPDED